MVIAALDLITRNEIQFPLTNVNTPDRICLVLTNFIKTIN